MCRLLVVVFLLSLVACGGPKIPPKKPITLDEVPASIMKIAREKLPDVKFERAWRKDNGEYEISGKNKQGKVREIDITPEGKVTEIE